MEFVTDSFGVQRPSLTERRAGRVGFDAPATNTSGVRVADDFHSSSLEIRAPYLTIPYGLSPTMLLDSPMFLSNLQDQPSPTTGSFPSVQTPQRSKSLEGINPQSSDSKPRMESIPPSFPSRGNQPGSTMDLHQFLPSMEASVGFPPQGSNLSSIKASTDDVELSDLCRGNDRSPPPDGSQDEENRGGNSSFGLGGLAEDGYNWRKYGQKQVKGSEYPRSYYKCTNLNCQVKKKVERNHEGQVTEIIYKGGHNHQKPLPIRRPGFPSSSSSEFQVEGHDWRNANDLEGAPPHASIAELDVSSNISNDEDEDQVTHGSTSLGCDGEDEESEAKKRKHDVCAAEMSASSRAAREQKVVVQTT
uniref:Putative WRKY transcription factor 2 n=1 Tax=Iris lactea var. lactea TaxID=338655 RepID=A0A4P8L6D5_9ASPA|nr:putative WRKY transcription factor 2 [Iris lactea var. lactea]